MPLPEPSGPHSRPDFRRACPRTSPMPPINSSVISRPLEYHASAPDIDRQGLSNVRGDDFPNGSLENYLSTHLGLSRNRHNAPHAVRWRGEGY